MRIRTFVFGLFFTLLSCHPTEQSLAETVIQLDNEKNGLIGDTSPIPLYQVSGRQILKRGQPIHFKGVNTLNTFGIERDGKLAEWNVEIVREFIGNLREQPITGYALQDTQGKWLHSLDSIVYENRKYNRVTILCPFGWVDNQGNQTMFTGKNPSEQSFWVAYQSKMKEIAARFAGQQDVWLQVWNEPYHWNNDNGYSHQQWLNDHQAMVANLRSVPRFDNIILVQGNEQGQGEEVLLEKASDLQNDYDNLLFDLHAYGKWHDGATQTTIENRLQRLIDAELPIIFGEVGSISEGASEVSDTRPFLRAVQNRGISTLAWVWLKDSNQHSALLTDDGAPNDENNFEWGSAFRAFLEE